MRLMPRSLHGRLLALSLAAMLVALGVAGIAIGGVLERFVTSTLDARLGDKLGALSGAVRKDGSLDRAYIARFDTLTARDADWRIEAPGGTAGSTRVDGQWGVSLADGQLLGPIAGYSRAREPPRPPRGPLDAGPPDLPARPFEGRLTDGERVHGRWQTVPTDRGDARIAVAVPRDLIERPLREALVPLSLSLLALGAALALAAVVQLRLGLRPLRALRGQVAAIRAGRATALPGDQPAELAPLADELNALAADNRDALATARRSAANLAHALKTPVATLALELADDPARMALVARIDTTIRHHLARARAEAVDRRAATLLAPAVADLAAAMRALHAERPVTIDTDVAAGLTAAVDPRDLDELVGNLLDNAMRHAASRIAVTASPDPGDGRRLRIEVRDDGPGIPADARARVAAPGVRLDERGDGHGFGLAIVADLAALYGGALMLGEAPGGGLSATLTLPAGVA